MKNVSNSHPTVVSLTAGYLGRGDAPGKLMLPDGSSVSRDCRVTGLNNNVLISGQSGTGKSTTLGIPNLIEGNFSAVVSDPKGTLYRALHRELTVLGYDVLRLDLTHPESSAHYNPLVYARKPQEIRRIAHAVVQEGNPNKDMSRDPYWENAAESLLCALIAYLRERKDHFGSKDPVEAAIGDIRPLTMPIDPEESAPEPASEVEPDTPEPTLSAVSDLLSDIEALDDLDDRKKTKVFRDFRLHEQAMRRIGHKSWACKMFSQFRSLSEKTLSCVISTLASLMIPFEGEELEALFSGNDFDFRVLGQRKTALFVIVSDSDRSNDLLANLFYTQAMNQLCDYADNHCPNGALPVPVSFVLDDFSTNCHIYGFENMISNIRARNISTMLMIQSLSQLRSRYGDDAETILNNCDTSVFMGANSLGDAEYFAKRANVATHVMLNLPRYSSYVFRHGEPPRALSNQNPETYLLGVRRKLREEICARRLRKE